MMAELSETDRIEQDIARTRARMDDRLDELQEKMSPTQLLNDGLAYFGGGNGADFANDLITRAKANPVPLALAAFGLVWLITSNRQAIGAAARPSGASDDLEARLRHAEAHVHRYDDEHEDAFSSRLDDARGKAIGVQRQPSDTASSYGQRIKDALAGALQTVNEKSHDAQAGVSDAFASFGASFGNGVGRARAALQEGTQTMTRSARDTISTISANPLAIGAVAGLVGVIAGALIPAFDGEEQLLGSTAGKLRAAGRDLAQDVVDRGGKVASDTLEAVKGSADAHGLTADKSVGDLVRNLTSGDLVEDVGQVAHEALQAGQDSAQTHFSTVGEPG